MFFLTYRNDDDDDVMLYWMYTGHLSTVWGLGHCLPSRLDFSSALQIISDTMLFWDH